MEIIHSKILLLYSWCHFKCILLFLLLAIRPNLSLDLEQDASISSDSILEEVEGGEEMTTTIGMMMTDNTNVSESSADVGSQGIFCPGKSVDIYQDTYGRFVLPQTLATVNGTRVVSDCPNGAISDGAVLIYDEQIQNKLSRTTQQDSAGLTSFCYLDIERTDQQSQWSPLGIWKHEADEHLNKCREQITENLKHSVSTLTTTTLITKNHMRQAIPKLQSLLRYSYKDYDSAQTLMNGVSRLLEESELFQDPDPSMNVYRKSLFGIIQAYATNAILQPGEKVSVVSSSISVETVMFPETIQDDMIEDDQGGNEDNLQMTSYSYDFETLHLPPEVVTMAMMTAETHKKPPRLRLVAYSNQLFSHWGMEQQMQNSSMNNSSSIGSGNSSQENETDFVGNWRVLTVQTEGSFTQNLSEPIVYTLSVNRTATNDQWQWACVYWDANANKWLSTGMRIITFPNGTIIRFLLEPIPPKNEKPPRENQDGNKDGTDIGNEQDPSQHSQLDTIHSNILSILSSVGSVLSITGLAMTIVTYALFRCLRKDRSNRILLNMSMSLFGLHLMSLISTKDMWNNACLVPAFLLHYLLLSSISWMLVEALHMYSLLICVFVKPQSRFLLKRAVCAWGIPFVIVLICACVKPQVYKEGRGEWCMMGGDNLTMYYTSYLGPAAAMLLINCFVFIRIVRVLCQQGANVKKQSKMVTPEIKFEGFNNDKVDWKTKKKPVKTTSFLNISPTQVKGAITVMVLLGVGWILGFLALGPFEYVFRYLFCLCNAGQGIFIFLFRVVFHPQASRTWRRAIKRGFSSDSDLSSFGSSSRKSQAFASSSYSSSTSAPSIISPSDSMTNTVTKSDPLSSKLAMTLSTALHLPSTEAEASASKTVVM